MESQLQELLWGAGILALPLLLALPMRLAWQFWVGVGHEVSEYRTVVRQIVDSGHQVSSFSQTLDDIARNLRIPPAKQRLIEAELLHPLTLSHFLLLPALLILPLSAIMALPLILIGFQRFKAPEGGTPNLAQEPPSPGRGPGGLFASK